MLRTMNLLIALSFGTKTPEDSHRTRFTCKIMALVRSCTSTCRGLTKESDVHDRGRVLHAHYFFSSWS